MQLTDLIEDLMQSLPVKASAEQLEDSYIRHVSGDLGDGYGVYLSDGTQLAVFPNRDAAFYTARQFDLNPQQVH